jgi:hypothetical protein
VLASPGYRYAPNDHDQGRHQHPDHPPRRVIRRKLAKGAWQTAVIGMCGRLQGPC